MNFLFSPLGALYLALLFIPNVRWATLRGRQASSSKESAPLLVLERVGQISTTSAVLFAPVRDAPGALRFACLAASMVAMALYELSWLRYFRSDLTERSLYRRLGPVPVPLAVLPVAGVMLLSLFESHVVLFGAVVVLGIGHVGIHWGHARRLS